MDAIDKEIVQALRMKSFSGLNLLKFDNISDIEKRLQVLSDDALQRLKLKMHEYEKKGGEHIKKNLEYIDNDIKKRLGAPNIEQEKTPPIITPKMEKEEEEEEDYEDMPVLLTTPLHSNIPFLSQIVASTKALYETPRNIIQRFTQVTPPEENVYQKIAEKTYRELDPGENVYQAIADKTFRQLNPEDQTHILSKPVNEGEEVSHQAEVENLEKQEQQLPKVSTVYPNFDEKEVSSSELEKAFKESIQNPPNPLDHLGVETTTTGYSSLFDTPELKIMRSPLLKQIQEDINKLPEDEQSGMTEFIKKYASILLTPYKNLKSFIRDFNKTDAGVLIRKISKTQIGKDAKKAGIELNAIEKSIEKGTKANADGILDTFIKHGFPKKIAVALTIIIVVLLSTDSYLKHRRSRKSVLPSFMSAHGKKK